MHTTKEHRPSFTGREVAHISTFEAWRVKWEHKAQRMLPVLQVDRASVLGMTHTYGHDWMPVKPCASLEEAHRLRDLLRGNPNMPIAGLDLRSLRDL